MPIQSYTGPFGREELKHLLRRTLFGATLEDLAFFEGQTLDQVIDVLLDVTNDTAPPIKAYSGGSLNNPDPDALDPQVAFGSTWVDTPRYGNTDEELTELTGARIQSYMWWRTGLMVQQGRSIREKMVLFWFNQLPTQVFGIFNPRLSYEYDQLLRDGCLGQLPPADVRCEHQRTAMLIYLNGYLNTAAAPDENYARELMELFTLGEGSGLHGKRMCRPRRRCSPAGRSRADQRRQRHPPVDHFPAEPARPARTSSSAPSSTTR